MIQAIVKGHHMSDKAAEQKDGYVSSLLCALENGADETRLFKVTFKRTNAPAVGSTIHISHKGFTRKGLPMYPKYEGLVEEKDMEGKRKPLMLLKAGQSIHIESTTQPGTFYAITRSHNGTHVYCSCPAWKYQRLNPLLRTCKHLQAYVFE